MGCPAKLRLRILRPPDIPPQLVITVSETNHEGHDLSQESARLLPENRKIQVEDRAKLLLSCGTLKTTELRTRLEEDNNVCLLSHDVYNLKRKLCGRGSDSDECEQRLKEIERSGGVVSIGRSECGELDFLFFMTETMRHMVSLYPEVIILDATYKTNMYLYPLLTAMVIDGEGHGVPVMHSYLKREDRASMEHCLRLFSQQYTFASTKCFVVDKDMAEISALQTVFPETPVNLCSFHIHQAVKRFLKKELHSESVDTVVDMFMSMVYTESEEEFRALKHEISEIVPQSVSDYFRTNWWEKVGLWAACFNIDVVRLHATTTNHLESYHGKIKKLLHEKLTLSSSLRELVNFDKIKIADCRRKLLIKANSVCYDQRDSDETSRTITMRLTRFAADRTKGQLSCARTTCYEVVLLHDSLYSVAYREKSYQTTVESCSCSYFQRMTLPCRHIFVLRNHLGLELFSIDLVPPRFLLSNSPPTASFTGEGSLITVSTPSLSLRTQEGRFRKAKSVCDSIVSYLSILGVEEFSEKIAQLQDLRDLWNFSSGSPSRQSPGRLSGILPTTSFSNSVPSSLDVRPAPPDASLVVAFSPPPATSSVAAFSPPTIPPHVVSPPFVFASAVVPPPPALSPPFVFDSAVVSPPPALSPPFFDSAVVPPPPTLSPPFGFDSAVVSPPPAFASTVVPSPPSTAPPVMPSSPPVFSGCSTGTSSSPLSFSGIKLARLKRPRGRPCNSQRFTLKRKRVGPRKFDALSLAEKQVLILKAVCQSTVDVSHASALSSSDLMHFTHFLDTVVDPSVDISIVRSFFDDDSWLSLEDGVSTRRHDALFRCGDCGETDDLSQKMIMCEKCLQWFHFSCAGYRSKMKVPVWFCQSCFSA